MTWLVVGSGLSGQSAIKLLLAKGYQASLYDDFLTSEKVFSLKKYSLVKAYGADDQEELFLTPFEGIVLSPGVSPTHPIVKHAKKNKISLYSEIDFALRYINSSLLVISGTNGKSTTTLFCQHLLTALGKKCLAAGNIGTPLSAIAQEQTQPEWLALEVSSFQIEQSAQIPASYSILTSLSRDHSERHPDFFDYLSIKAQLLASPQKGFHAFISTQAQETLIKHKVQYPSSTQTIKKETLSLIQDLQLFPPHDEQNAALAVSVVAVATKTPVTTLVPLLRSFSGLPHRFEKIGFIHQALVINDSKATNIEATLAALHACKGPTLLFLGGKPKDKRFASLTKFKEKICHIIAFGEARDEIKQQLSSHFTIQVFPSLKQALEKFHAILKSEQHRSILFSPGCASYDEFDSFISRGQFFCRTVAPYLTKKATEPHYDKRTKKKHQ